MKAIGSRVIVILNESDIGTLQSKSEEYILVDYSEE